jgi:hypothetical protein
VDVFYNTDKNTRDFEHREDAESIAQYGRRYMRISEEQYSNIDTSTEASILADAAIADQKDPFASHAISLPLWPFVELNDVQKYVANDVQYDQDQGFTVVAYSHQFTKGGGTTTISARGKPVAAYRRYRLGDPRKTHVSLTEPPPDDVPAKEKAVWFQVDSLAFP